MLSDTLWEARDGIEHYEREYAEEFREIAPALAKVKTVLRAMQAACELCPVGKSRNRAWQLVGAIEALDTTALTRLLETPIEPAKQNRKQPA